MTGVEDLYLEAKARIRPWLSYVFHIRSKQKGNGVGGDLFHGVERLVELLLHLEHAPLRPT